MSLRLEMLQVARLAKVSLGDDATAKVAEFIEEITEESNLSHHIKNVIQEDIPALENVIGFTITKPS